MLRFGLVCGVNLVVFAFAGLVRRIAPSQPNPTRRRTSRSSGAGRRTAKSAATQAVAIAAEGKCLINRFLLGFVLLM